MPETRSWDGAAYDRLSTPMEQLGREVKERLELRGDETILDAGCGSGRLTQLLLERVPAGRPARRAVRRGGQHRVRPRRGAPGRRRPALPRALRGLARAVELRDAGGH